MGKFNYYYLKQAALEHRRIGGWKGHGVFSCAARNYNPLEEDYYVIYDDENALVRNSKKYGYITDNGDVKETAVTLWIPPSASSEQKVEKVVPASEYSATVATDEYFSKLDREINELLATVGEVDLLKGLNFNG